MRTGKLRQSRPFRPREERLEDRLVMSHNSVPAQVLAILASSPGGSPIRPNTPVLPLESAFATASFLDPTVKVVAGNRAAVGQKDYIAPYVTLNATKGVIKIGSSTTIQDHAKLVANPNHQSSLTGIFIGDNVVIGDGVTIEGPSAIGSTGGAATSIGANALIDGAIIQPGAFVGALARVGPGVIVPTGFRVLPGANVTTSAQASTPSMGKVVAVTSTDTFGATATKVIAANSALALGYATLYQGTAATGGAASAGPIPAPISAAGSTIFFGALNTVEGASSEPGSRSVSFEPTAGTPLFVSNAGTFAALLPNASYKFGARVIGLVSVGQTAGAVSQVIGQGDSIRADEGQGFTIASIARLGNAVSIHSPLGGVQGTTTTTVTTTTVTAGVTTKTTTATVLVTSAAPTATAGSTTTTTSGTNAQGVAFTGTVTTVIAVKTTNLGAINIGNGFQAGDFAVLLGGPSATSTIGSNVTIGSGAVVTTSSIGAGSLIGNRSYISGSTIPAGSIVPAGSIIINNVIVGTVQW